MTTTCCLPPSSPSILLPSSWLPPSCLVSWNHALLCSVYNDSMRSNGSQMKTAVQQQCYIRAIQAHHVISLFSRLLSGYLMIGPFPKPLVTISLFVTFHMLSSFLLLPPPPILFSLHSLSLSLFSMLCWEGIIMEPVFESFWFKQPDNGLLIEATRRQTIGFNAT